MSDSQKHNGLVLGPASYVYLEKSDFVAEEVTGGSGVGHLDPAGRDQ